MRQMGFTISCTHVTFASLVWVACGLGVVECNCGWVGSTRMESKAMAVQEPAFPFSSRLGGMCMSSTTVLLLTLLTGEQSPAVSRVIVPQRCPQPVSMLYYTARGN